MFIWDGLDDVGSELLDAMTSVLVANEPLPDVETLAWEEVLSEIVVKVVAVVVLDIGSCILVAVEVRLLVDEVADKDSDVAWLETLVVKVLDMVIEVDRLVLPVLKDVDVDSLVLLSTVELAIMLVMLDELTTWAISIATADVLEEVVTS